MAFTTLVLFQLFNVFNARSDEQSAFSGLFRNRWLWGALLLSLGLQAAVLYAPFLQRAFDTVGLSLADWVRCTLVASSVLWLREVSKLASRHVRWPPSSQSVTRPSDVSRSLNTPRDAPQRATNVESIAPDTIARTRHC
jgi:magnesium-transporting ATPase (P-type)